MCIAYCELNKMRFNNWIMYATFPLRTILNTMAGPVCGTNYNCNSLLYKNVNLHPNFNQFHFKIMERTFII